MTPAARVAAAIDALDTVLGGTPAEKSLTNWARRARYAGAGDRAAVRDLVYDALRCRRSFGWCGGADTGRGLMIGALRAAHADPASYFSGQGYAAPPLTDTEERARLLADAPLAVRLDLPDWLMPGMQDSLGRDLVAVAELMRQRAPLFLRVNLRKATPARAMESLRGETVETRPAALSATALEVIGNPRRVKGSVAFRTGLVEIQDAASQALADALPVAPGDRVLDYCAGGGGKSLAIGARIDARLYAHDADTRRMRDIPARAARAGIAIERVAADDLARQAPFDLVLCDVPCSGSGAWRRVPEAKWRLVPDRLRELQTLQAEILQIASRLVRPGGVLAYATCSLLRAENEAQIDRFVAANPSWTRGESRRFSPLEGGDGFFKAELIRPAIQS